MYDPTNPHPEVPFAQRETIDLDAAPEPRPSRWRWVIDRNPLFLISGVCMLGGCFLVSGVIHGYDPAVVGDWPVLTMLIALLAVLNVYEIAVIWLGLALSRSQTLVRDTRHLLGLALLLIVDASFVYNETSIFKPEIGVLIAAMAALLALIKACWVLRALGIQPTRGAAVAVSTALVLMYAMPVAVRLMAHDGFLSQPFAMVVWCALGAVPALYALPLQWVRFKDSDSADHRQLQRLIAGGLIVLPLVSLIGHAAALLWIYENTFELSMLSPLLLGLAAVILRQQHRLGGPAASAKAAAIVVGCAVVPSLLPAEDLIVESVSYSWLAFSPLRGVLLLAPAVLFWGWWINGRRTVGAIVVALPLIAAALGHTPSAMVRHARWLLDLIVEYLPKTQLQWGSAAITMAFICLGLGGLVSWKRLERSKGT